MDAYYLFIDFQTYQLSSANTSENYPIQNKEDDMICQPKSNMDACQKTDPIAVSMINNMSFESTLKALSYKSCKQKSL